MFRYIAGMCLLLSPVVFAGALEDVDKRKVLGESGEVSIKIERYELDGESATGLRGWLADERSAEEVLAELVRRGVRQKEAHRVISIYNKNGYLSKETQEREIEVGEVELPLDDNVISTLKNGVSKRFHWAENKCVISNMVDAPYLRRDSLITEVEPMLGGLEAWQKYAEKNPSTKLSYVVEGDVLNLELAVEDDQLKGNRKLHVVKGETQTSVLKYTIESSGDSYNLAKDYFSKYRKVENSELRVPGLQVSVHFSNVKDGKDGEKVRVEVYKIDYWKLREVKDEEFDFEVPKGVIIEDKRK